MAWVMIAGSLFGIVQEACHAGPKPAKDGEHWAFRPVRRLAVPAVRDRSWVRTPIDAHILSRLEKDGRHPAAAADRRTLLRRVYLDLIGLPPTPEEQRAFLQDSSPDAYARVVDRLLAMPAYGERWARHWLDVVRYAESNGYERDGTKPHAWRYRDYVIRSLNKDEPYDRFLTEQLAGDEVAGSNAETQIGATFLRLGTWDDEPADPLVDRYDQLDDVLGTTATAFLGITLRCARCHDHKFEPFSQADYYSMLAVFEPLKRPLKDREEVEVHVGTEAELAAYREALARPSAEVVALQKQISSLEKTIRERLFAAPLKDKKAASGQKRTTLPRDAIAAFQTEANKRTAMQNELVKKFSGTLEKEIQNAATEDERALRRSCEKRIAALQAARIKAPPQAYIWYEDGANAPATHLFRRGDPTKPRDTMPPALPAVLVKPPPEPPRPLAKSTGRRLWLARWIASPGNPLTARVMANRVWQHHFGQGLVASENDFGVMGQPPSHPELLDWLASEFMAGGWRLKPLHRLMVLSNAYQVSCRMDRRSVLPARGEAALPPDSEGGLLARWRQRRLEAEAVRDSILFVSGRLNPQMAGESVYPALPRAVLEGQSRPGDGWGKSDERQASRRSVYVFVKRSLAVPELDLLDTPDTTSSCERRAVSTTGPQALTFLNGDLTHQQAHHFAARLEREAGREPEAQVVRAFELALCRPPEPGELRSTLEFLTQQEKQIEADLQKLGQTASDLQHRALTAFCLVLLNTNEFVYLN
jgi:hypothetical protein